MIRLTGQRIFDVTLTLAKIIKEKRPMPGKGIYRVARIHAKLLPEFTVLNDQRSAKINSYDHKAWVDPNGNVVVPDEMPTEALVAMVAAKGLTEQAAVPDDKMPEFVAWWNELASVDMEVNIESIPIDQLCIDGQEGSISFAEFAILADLVQG